MRAPQRIAIIGYGAVAQAVLRHLAPHQAGDGRGAGVVDLRAVLLRPGWRQKERAEPPVPLRFLDSIDELLSLELDLVLECAGQGAVAQYADRIVSAGVDLLAISMAPGSKSIPIQVESGRRFASSWVECP